MEKSSQLDREPLKALEELEKKTGKKIIPQLAQMYLQSAPELLTSMRVSLAESNWEEVGRYAHTLKSSSAYLGARLIRSVCSEIEDIAHGASDDKAKNLELLILNLNSYLLPTLQEIKKLLIL